ncbi:MAG: thioredoxin family protein [Candidatus Babeliales bacterium]|nr:thioredoxin family protein [Candidatus Babeliales bacterium]
MRTLQLITLTMLAVALNLQAGVKEVTTESDINKDGYAIVKFYADWCPPCKAFKPDFEELAKKYSDKGNFYAVNVDTQTDVSSKYNIQSLPTIGILLDNKLVEKVGRGELEEKLQNLKAPTKKVEVKKEVTKRKMSVVTETKTVKKQKKSCADCDCNKK